MLVLKLVLVLDTCVKVHQQCEMKKAEETSMKCQPAKRVARGLRCGEGADLLNRFRSLSNPILVPSKYLFNCVMELAEA